VRFIASFIAYSTMLTQKTPGLADVRHAVLRAVAVGLGEVEANMTCGGT
jgi:hypothetical protein